MENILTCSLHRVPYRYNASVTYSFQFFFSILFVQRQRSNLRTALLSEMRQLIDANVIGCNDVGGGGDLSDLFFDRI